MYGLKIAVVIVVGASLILSSLVVMSNLSVLAQEATPSLVKDVTIPANAATMGDKAYSPNPVEVKVGGGVTWANDDSQIYTATSGSAGSADSGSVFDSGILSPGATFDFVFDTAGTYDYYCTMHPQMVGTVTVS
ncbi:MAG TPA: plastocyanin/azurin family copper-binding protein [Nitrososphaeraceae archaeon]|nr:plastocyanin/azurin family copper-binding protein [Nitrososphaeraceae archaeon]